MEKNKQEQRKIQQNLLNYVSHNLTNKKEKPKENERSGSKSSTGRETKTSADKAGATNVTSGPKQQRTKTGAGTSASGNNTESTRSSSNRQSTQGGSARVGTIKTITPTSNQNPKTRTPPSIERSNPPPKKLNIEMHASQSRNSPIIDDITRQNVSQEEDSKKPGTRSNSSNMETTITPRQNINESLSEGEVNEANETVSVNIRMDNNAVINPYDDEMDTDETLEDLGAKMGRILTKEITKSLFAALVPLQNEINESKSLKIDLIPATRDMTLLKKENNTLRMKVDQLETKNLKLKERLSDIEDKLLENNLMFFGLDERDGETEYDR